MGASTALIWLLGTPLVAAPFIYMAGRLGVRRAGGTAVASGWLALLTLAGMGVPLYVAAESVLTFGPTTVSMGRIVLHFDGVSLLMAATVWGLTLAVTVYSMAYVSRETSEEKYFALLVAMAGTMIGLATAGDLFNLWVWFEGMAITSYMLVAFYNHQKGALEAGVKYLVQSAAGSMLVLLGIALVFAQTGTVTIADARAAIQGPTPQLLAAGALFLIGFGVKAAMVPMHTWLPDAHSQAPSGISAMLSGVVIEAGLVALLRSCLLAFVSPSWGTFLLGFGALNMLVGNALAGRPRQAAAGLLQPGPHRLHAARDRRGHGVPASGPRCRRLLPPDHPHVDEGARLPRRRRPALLAVPLTRQPPVARARRPERRGHALPGDLLRLTIALLALGGLPPLAGFMSKWQIFVARRDPQLRGRRAGGVRRAEQRAFAGLLRAGGQRDVPQGTLGDGACRAAGLVVDGHAAGGADGRDSGAGHRAETGERSHRTGGRQSGVDLLGTRGAGSPIGAPTRRDAFSPEAVEKDSNRWTCCCTTRGLLGLHPVRGRC